MAQYKIEYVINNTLKGDAQTNALDFVEFLRANDISIPEESENYWEAKYKDAVMCFLWISGTENKPGPWTIWSNGQYENYPVEENIKEIAWENVNPCGYCGGACCPGKTKTIFGKEFHNICSSDIAFTNPDSAAIKCAKKLVEIRKSEC